MIDQNKQMLPPHWSRGWAHCAFTPQEPIIFGNGETILLAEKDPMLLKLGKSLLENLKYRALTANSKADVLEQCNREKVDAIVFDLELDHHCADVENFLSETRRLQPSLKVMLSSAEDVSLGINPRPLHGLPTLTKPYTVRSFSQAISRCLGNG